MMTSFISKGGTRTLPHLGSPIQLFTEVEVAIGDFLTHLLLPTNAILVRNDRTPAVVAFSRRQKKKAFV